MNDQQETRRSFPNGWQCCLCPQGGAPTERRVSLMFEPTNGEVVVRYAHEQCAQELFEGRKRETPEGVSQSRP